MGRREGGRERGEIFTVDCIFYPPSFLQYLFISHEPQSRGMGVVFKARHSVALCLVENIRTKGITDAGL